MSELLLLLILALIFIFTPDTYIGSKYRLSVYLICNNRYRYRPWKTHIGRPLIHTHIYIYIYIYIFSSCYSKHVWLIFFCEKQKKIFFKGFIGKCFNKTTLDPIRCQMKIHFTNEDYFCFQLNYPFKKARNHIVRFVSCTETKTWLPRNKKDITAKHGYNCHVCGPWLDLCLEKLACAFSAYRTIISWGWLCCYHKSFSARLFCF